MKSELTKMRKELKYNNSGRLKINKIYNAYCKMNEGKIIHTESNLFNMYDEEMQELFYANFKKLLTGAIGTKLFDLGFVKGEEGVESQKFLYKLLQGDDFEATAEELVNKIMEEYKHDKDYLVTIASIEFYIPTGKGKDEDFNEDETADTESKFVVCSLNRIEPPKKALKFDYEEKELTTQSSLDMTINLNKPTEGFLFPVINEGYSDVNRVLYSSCASNMINQSFANGILGCEVTLTSKQERELFTELLSSCVGSKIKPEVMHSVYSKIAGYKVDNESPSIGTDDLKEILAGEGLDISKFDGVVASEMGVEKAVITVDSLVPSSGRSIKLNNSDVSVAITPRGLKKVKQTLKNGKKYLTIELDESINLDGFELEAE